MARRDAEKRPHLDRSHLDNETASGTRESTAHGERFAQLPGHILALTSVSRHAFTSEKSPYTDATNSDADAPPVGGRHEK